MLNKYSFHLLCKFKLFNTTSILFYICFAFVQVYECVWIVFYMLYIEQVMGIKNHIQYHKKKQYCPHTFFSVLNSVLIRRYAPHTHTHTIYETHKNTLIISMRMASIQPNRGQILDDFFILFIRYCCYIVMLLNKYVNRLHFRFNVLSRIDEPFWNYPFFNILFVTNSSFDLFEYK